MKKINIFLAAIAFLGIGLTGCNNEEVLPPVTYPAGGNAETIGSGAWDDPYSVWQVLAGIDNGNNYEWVTGYIVGYINTFNGDYSKLREKSAVFDADGAPNSNLLLASSPDEKNWERCIPVQLAYGTSGRDLSLANHPEYLHRQVTLRGTTGTKYLSVYGLRNCDDYNWGDKGKYSAEADENALVYLTKNMDGFTVDNVSLPDVISSAWKWDSNYNNATASAFANNTNYNAEAYLISPEIQLSDDPIVTFNQAVNYLRGNNRADYLEVCVREGVNGQWKVVNVSEWPEGTSWTWSDNCAIDVSAYAEKKIQIGFHYKSTTSCSPTWEIKSLVIR